MSAKWTVTGVGDNLMEPGVVLTLLGDTKGLRLRRGDCVALTADDREPTTGTVCWLKERGCVVVTVPPEADGRLAEGDTIFMQRMCVEIADIAEEAPK